MPTDFDPLDQEIRHGEREGRAYIALVTIACIGGTLWGVVKVLIVVVKITPDLWPF